MAEVVLSPLLPFVVEDFKTCEGLGRVAILDSGNVVMIGKVMSVVHC